MWKNFCYCMQCDFLLHIASNFLFVSLAIIYDSHQTNNMAAAAYSNFNNNNLCRTRILLHINSWGKCLATFLGSTNKFVNSIVLIHVNKRV